MQLRFNVFSYRPVPGITFDRRYTGVAAKPDIIAVDVAHG
jgi:hypothetical protein